MLAFRSLKEGIMLMKSRNFGRLIVAVLLVLAMLAAVSASAATYSKVYGQTTDRLRVRESASTGSATIDNVEKSAAVYVVNSKTNASGTFVEIRYRGREGSILTGWLCQRDAKQTYVRILSAAQAKKSFGVQNGELPTKRAGIYTKAQRDAMRKLTVAAPETADAKAIQDAQTKLKALGFYAAEVTGHAGTKTVAAIRAFQKKYGLTADGVLGPKTIAKLSEVYARNGGSSASSGSSKVGDKASIESAQRMLKELGIYSAEITGNAGEKTVAAIRAFQKRYNLTADGVLGAKTEAKLREVYAARGGSSSSGSTTGNDVAEAQRKLKALGLYTGEITGNAGSKTVAAIRAFQKKYNLSADGVLGKNTMAKLREVYGGTADASKGGDIADAQMKLKALGLYSGEVTGNAGEKTVAAIRAFQKKYNLTVDGVLGKNTMAKLSEVYSGSGASSKKTTASTSVLREGSTGAAVTTLQENLTALGLYHGDITGHYGSMTASAVRQFQKKKGLSQTGTADKATQNAIKSAVNGTGSSSNGTVSLYGRIAKNNVVIRADHSTKSQGKTTLPKGLPMKITKRYGSGDAAWYYGSVYKGDTRYAGWVSGPMLTLISYSDYQASIGEGNSADEILGIIRVTHDGVAIREDADKTSAKVGTANAGDTFYYIAHKGGWYTLRNGTCIMDSYAKRVSDSEAADWNKGEGGAVAGSYRYGDTGATVTWIQQTLKALGFYSGDVTGHYGTKTEAAVKSFQSKRGLTADGIVGSKTLAELQGSGSSGGSSGEAPKVNIGATIYNLKWFDAKANGTLGRIGLVAKHKAKLTDLRTKKSMNIYIQSAGNHLDVEPLTASDTQTLCSMFGVSSASNIGYQARPMLITSDTGKQLVCSIYGTPHGQQYITDNNYPGQFCLHFWDSKTHNSGQVLQRHKDAINEASKILGTGKVTTTSSL